MNNLSYLHYVLSYLFAVGVCSLIYWDVTRLINAGAMVKKQRKSLIPVFKLIGCYTGMALSMRYMAWTLNGTSTVALLLAMIILAIPFTLFLGTRFIKTFGYTVTLIYPAVQFCVLAFLSLTKIL